MFSFITQPWRIAAVAVAIASLGLGFIAFTNAQQKKGADNARAKTRIAIEQLNNEAGEFGTIAGRCVDIGGVYDFGANRCREKNPD